jgi:nucleotide sugar dehydrogenase
MTQSLVRIEDERELEPDATTVPTVAVVGLGYVGLPTSLALQSAGMPVVGIDISESRLAAIRACRVDMPRRDRVRLGDALHVGRLSVIDRVEAIARADAVVICVPTPVDRHRAPDTTALRAACAAAVTHARAGQTIILTSTTAVGSTRELLIDPLAARGLAAGSDVFVAFAPERINPGDAAAEQTTIPRVLGGATPECTAAAARVLRPIARELHALSSPEAAELTKLYENTFRAVNLAFANEMSSVARHYGLDPIELVEAAATKPYGFLPHHPGPGVGGHCIPVDPHYLIAPLREAGVSAPVTERALDEIDARPAAVADRALEALRGVAGASEGARVLIVGMAYKPGVADARESPAAAIAGRLAAEGVLVEYHDPLVTRTGEYPRVDAPRPERYHLVVVATVHPGHDYAWLHDCEHVLDATYRTPGGRHRHVV